MRSRSVLIANSVFLSFIVAVAGNAGISGSSSHERASAAVLGNFGCYSATFSEFVTRKVALADLFAKQTALVGRPMTLCSPADLNGQGIGDQRAHLTCHPLKAATRAIPSVRVRNQLGLLTVAVLRLQTLCVPTSTATGGGALAPPPTTLDSFTCYSIKRVAFKQRDVVLRDEFGTSTDRVIAPNSLCAPASVDGSRRLQTRVLACYRVDSLTKGRPVVARSRFGLLTPAPGLRGQLCLPSVRLSG